MAFRSPCSKADAAVALARPYSFFAVSRTLSNAAAIFRLFWANFVFASDSPAMAASMIDRRRSSSAWRSLASIMSNFSTSDRRTFWYS